VTAPVWSWRYEDGHGNRLEVSVAVNPDAPAGLLLHVVERDDSVCDLAMDRASALSLAQFLADWAGLP
jgi:hypothetical protein